MKKKFFYFLISKLPQFLRHYIYRKLYARVPTHDPAGLVFELARTQEELESAFKLLHDAYVEQGFIETQDSGMRLIVQHALPTTSILVAKIDGRVIGTISVMRNTPLGLPMEKAFNISSLKLQGKRVAELSCLAIHPSFRRKMGADVFFPLTLYAAIYAKKHFGTDYLVFNLYPHHADFYNAIFGSTHLQNNKKETIDYLGAPATGIKLDLNTVEAFALKKYSGLGPCKDLHAYTFVTSHSYFKFPDSKNGVINYPVMTPKLLQYFFIEKTKIFNNLSLLETQVLSKYYPGERYAKNFLSTQVLEFKKRIEPRWDIRLDGECVLPNNKSKIKLVLIDISQNGFRAHFSSQICENHVLSIEVNVFENQVAKIQAIVAWNFTDGVYGLRILESDELWNMLVETQSLELSKLAS